MSSKVAPGSTVEQPSFKKAIQANKAAKKASAAAAPSFRKAIKSNRLRKKAAAALAAGKGFKSARLTYKANKVGK